MKFVWSCAVLLVSALICRDACVSQATSSHVAPHTAERNEALCQWFNMFIRTQFSFLALQNAYSDEVQSMHSRHRQYVAGLTENEDVRNYKSVRKARDHTNDALTEAYGSAHKIHNLTETILLALKVCKGTFLHSHENLVHSCDKYKNSSSRPEKIEASALDLPLKLLEQFFALPTWPEFDPTDEQRRKVRELLQPLQQQKFLHLKEKTLKAFDAVVKLEAEAHKLKYDPEDKLLVGCEVARKLSVVKEIFLALRHVIADAIRRQNVLSKRIAVLGKHGVHLESVSAAEMSGAQSPVQNVRTEAEAGFDELMAFVTGGDGTKLRSEFGFNKELEVDGERCVDDVKDERLLLREAARQGRYNYRSFMDWKPAVDSLWGKVRNLDDIVRPKCHLWKGVNCHQLLVHIKGIMEKSDRRLTVVEVALSRTIESLMKVEKAVREAELQAGIVYNDDDSLDDMDAWDLDSIEAHGSAASVGRGKVVAAVTSSVVAVLVVGATVGYVLLRRRASSPKVLETSRPPPPY
ncbi:hypothetical protein ERJ75_001067900 [Trypanosoma vivax]|uniref:65 kDa invariant surface glycoprotein n=1 Tax=Trypanosoma vivax (strain Y486) TaxID=1055687 RepID=F9WRL7_TRYVY|nr:hypothetical protein ERJ75_001067900 [Trypanosoma vivax]CCD20201.1 hypothetical protein, conserved in T. vivax [Trypanosoma vivax Y486]|eukprot:CCD20201.1 hypothetical protein, conserved in T. vivax [Trypanosoma vivax Y486]